MRGAGAAATRVKRLVHSPAAKARAAELAARAQVQYSVILSYQDGLDLLAGRVPEHLRPQLLAAVKRDRQETAEAYALRIGEAR